MKDAVDHLPNDDVDILDGKVTPKPRCNEILDENTSKSDSAPVIFDEKEYADLRQDYNPGADKTPP